MTEISLGDRVKDRVTGFTGICTVISNWLNGCVRIGITYEQLRDGKPTAVEMFDIGQVDIVEKGVHTPMEVRPVVSQPVSVAGSTGGPEREGPGFFR